MSEKRIKERCKRKDIALKVVRGFLEKDCDEDTELFFSLETVLNLIENNKKKIEYLENEKERIGKLYYDASETCFKNKEIILKQQKEIEEMREELQMYVDTNLMKEKLEREIEKLKGIHKEFLKLHQELKAEDTFLSADNIIKAIRKNYISKDKIREVIGTPYPEIAIDNLLKLLEE